MKCFEVRRPDCSPQYVVLPTGKSVAENELDISEVGDVLEIRVVEFTQEELDALPEFEGW